MNPLGASRPAQRSSTSPDRGDDLDLLRLDYELYRHYESLTQQQNFSLMASILAASGVIVLAFFENTATLVFLFMPVIPLMLIGYTILTYATMAVASYYGRSLERALFARVGQAVDLKAGELVTGVGPTDLGTDRPLMPVPSLGHLVQMAVSNRGEILASRVVATFGLAFYALAAIAPVVITVLRLPSWGWKVAGIAFYAPVLTAAFAAGFYVAASPDRIWQRLVQELHSRWDRPLAPDLIAVQHTRRLPPGPPHLLTLLLPRPFEFAFKGVVIGGADRRPLAVR